MHNETRIWTQRFVYTYVYTLLFFKNFLTCYWLRPQLFIISGSFVKLLDYGDVNISSGGDKYRHHRRTNIVVRSSLPNHTTPCLRKELFCSCIHIYVLILYLFQSFRRGHFKSWYLIYWIFQTTAKLLERNCTDTGCQSVGIKRVRYTQIHIHLPMQTWGGVMAQ